MCARKVTNAKKNLNFETLSRDICQKEQNQLVVAKEKKCWERSYHEQDLVELKTNTVS